MDLFEVVQKICGCSFISDMAVGGSHNKAARVCVSFVQLKDYELHVLSDMYHYLTGEPVFFETAETAVTALCKLSSKVCGFQTGTREELC